MEAKRSELKEDTRRNREKVAARSKMWQTVGGSSDSSIDDVGGAAAGESRGHGSSRKRDRDDQGEPRKKRSKKEKRHREKDSKRDKQKKKKKKSKKRKRLPSSSSSSSSSDSSGTGVRRAGAIDQAEYGSKGIVRASDYYSKQREFECWMAEVKGQPGFNAGKGETAQMFAEYAEDYNTCTLPHEKPCATQAGLGP